MFKKLTKIIVFIFYIQSFLLSEFSFFQKSYSTEVYAQNNFEEVLGEIDNMRNMVGVDSGADVLNSERLKLDLEVGIVNNYNLELEIVENGNVDNFIPIDEYVSKINSEIPSKSDLNKNVEDMYDQFSGLIEKDIISEGNLEIGGQNSDLNKLPVDGDYLFSDDLMLDLDGSIANNLVVDWSNYFWTVYAKNGLSSLLINNNQVFDFDGKDDYIELQNSFLNSYPFTVSVWFNYDGNLNKQTIRSFFGEDSNKSFSLFVEDGFLYMSSIDNFVSKKSYDKKLYHKVWYNLTLVFEDNNKIVLYLDGKRVLSDSSINFSEDLNMFRFGIGKSFSDGYRNGLLDNIEIYNYDLKSQGIRNLYQSGVSLEIDKKCFKSRYTKDIVQGCMVSRGNNLGTGSVGKITDETVVVDFESIDLSNSKGKVKIALAQKTLNSLGGNKAEFFIKENTQIKTSDGNYYEGILQSPVFESTEIASEIGGDIVSVVKFGANEKLEFVDEMGDSVVANVRIPAPGLGVGDNVLVYSSQDAVKRDLFANSKVSNLNGESYVEFETTHFTYFAVGVEQGSFVINNDDVLTNSTSVTLNSLVSGALEMRFGNTIAERDSASRIPFSQSYSWVLDSGNGIKWVYAQFSGDGFVRNVSDGIVLETTTLNNGLSLYLDSSYLGNTFYDIAGSVIDFTASIAGIGSYWSTEQIMNFNGSNNLYRNNTPIITSTPFTISAWVKPDRITGVQGLVFRGRSTVNSRHYGINLNGNIFQVVARNGSTSRTANGPITAQVGIWYHVVGVFSANNNRTIYVDGVQGQIENNNVTLNSNSQQWTVGKYPGTATNRFSGSIDEVRVYNRVLSLGEVQDLFMEKPVFDGLVTHTSGPVLYGSFPTNITRVSVEINGNTYSANNFSGYMRKTDALSPTLPDGTYDVVLNYGNIYGKQSSVTYNSSLVIDTSSPFVVYEPEQQLVAGPSLAILTGLDPTYMITNNGGSNEFLFTGNGSFVFEFVDKVGNTGSRIANVTRINTGLAGAGVLTYQSKTFNESVLNDGGIDNLLFIDLTGDSFNSQVASFVEFQNLPVGLTPNVVYLSGSQIKLGLSGNALSHINTDDVDNISIFFKTGAFLLNYPSGVSGSYVSDLYLDFLDPFSTNGFTPIHDTTLDADTLPDNGCDDGVCQEANYGALTHGEVSSFGSVILQKYDLSSIPVGAEIYSATLRLTRLNYGLSIDDATNFHIRRLINNADWIEGRGNVGGAGALQSLPGEPNYKQCKWQQENWNNGNPGLVESVDYGLEDLVDNVLFSNTVQDTKTLYFNQTGISVLQDWLDNPSTNHGLAFVDADVERMLMVTKENSNTALRPLLTVYYLGDNQNPNIVDLSPNDGELVLSVDLDLSLDFDEYIQAGSGFLYIKRFVGDTIEKQISISDLNLEITGSNLKINLDGVLSGGLEFYITIDSGFVTDIAGNNFEGIFDKNYWNFTTTDIDNAPVVTGCFVTGITQSSGVFGGETSDIGSDFVTERGVFWSLNEVFSPADANKVFETGLWLNGGVFSFSIFGLPAGLDVYYRPYAVNSYGIGYGDIYSILMKPSNPIAKQSTEVSNRSFLANWNPVLGAEKYNLYVSTDSGFVNTLAGYNPKSSVYDTEYLVSSVEPETIYYYKVVAENPTGLSDYSNVIQLETTYLPFPIMHLKLEESVGDIAYDSASSHDAILDGNILKQQVGVDDFAYYFDGVDDKMTVVDYAYGPNFTVQFWFKDTINTTTEYLFSHGDLTDTNSVNVVLNGTTQTLQTYYGGQLLFEVGGQIYSDLLDGIWHMYTLTVDDNFAAGGKKKIAFYIDGVQIDIDASLVAGPYNPGPENMIMGRRSNNTAGTYYNGYLDDIRVYDTDLFDYEVRSIYEQLYIEKNPPYIEITSPLSGEVDVSIDKIIEIKFSKEVVHSSVEETGVVSIVPSLSGVLFSWTGKTLLLSHENFDFSTTYTVSINTGVQDLSGNYMVEPYQFSFVTQNDIYLQYYPETFVENIINDGSIANSIKIILTGDTFSPYVISSGYIAVANLPLGLSENFVLSGNKEIIFELSGSSLTHLDIDDVENLTVIFGDLAFTTYLASEVSNSTKNNLKINFNDPDSLGIYPIRDTTLDILNPNYNYGLANYHYIGGGSFVILEFDLSTLPIGATINSATLSFSKIDGVGSEFFVGELINNKTWIEGTKIGSTATIGESTYNQKNYNQFSRYNGANGLVANVDYDPTLLVNNVNFNGNETRVFTLNSSGLDVLTKWFENPNLNQGFLLYGGSDRLKIGSKENPVETLRPTLLVSYTPAPVDYLPPELTGIVVFPSPIVYNSGGQQNVSVDFDSSEYPTYLTYNLYSNTGLLVYSTGSFVVFDSGTTISGFIIPDYLSDGNYVLDYLASDLASNFTTGFLTNIVVDTVKPTATGLYISDSINYTGGNVNFILTGFSESGVITTNNGGSPYYTFTSNGSFTFEFVDLAGNTGIVVANVDWMEPLSIGAFSGFTFSGEIYVSNVLQTIEQQVGDYFWVNDPIGNNSGYYTTISVSDLTGDYGVIDSDKVFFKSNSIELLGGVVNSNVVFGIGIQNYVNISDPVVYIKRESGSNFGKRGKYGDRPWIKVLIDPYTLPGNYGGILTYTLYDW